MNEEKRFEDFRSRPSPETLVELLRGCQDTVYNLCFHVLRHPQNAEDASQKVFMTLLDQIPKITDGDHFRRWLRTVCLHVSLDLKRTQATARLHARAAAEHAVREPASDGGEVHEHLAMLEGEQRSLILEHYFERRPLEAMAGSRGCSAVTVWNRLQKALDRLRKSLVEAGFEKSAFGLDAFLLALVPVEAPRDLVTAAVAARAAEIAAVPTSMLAVGGTALKTKIVASVAVAGLFVLLTVPIARGLRSEAVEANPPLLRYRSGPTPVAQVTAVNVGTFPAEPPPEAGPGVEGFATLADFTRAFRKALFLLNDGERWRTLRKIGIRLTDDQLVQVQSRVRFKRGTHAYANVFQGFLIEAWATLEPKTAAAFFRDLPGTLQDPIKQELLSAALAVWRKADAAAAVRFGEALPEGTGRTRLLNQMAAFQDPAGFVSRLASMTDGERFKSTEDLSNAWPAVDPQAAARWFAELPAQINRNHFLGRALARWADRDLAASVQWTLQLPGDASRDQLVREALLGGASARPREAADLAWNLLKLSDPHTPSVMNGIAMAWMERDVAEGLRFADQLAERSVLGGERYLVVLRAAELDPAQALAWVNSRPEGEDRDHMIEAVFKGWALSDLTTPQKALEAARTLPEAVRSRAIHGLLVDMCDYDPAGACAFAAGLPPASVPFDPLGERFAYQDMAAAASWARTLPEPASRDQAITGILRLAKNWDLGLAVSLAREVSTPEGRRLSYIQLLDWVIQVPEKGRSTDVRLQGVLSAWTTTDPGTAGPWVDQANLSPELKAAAYKVVGDPRHRPPSRR